MNRVRGWAFAAGVMGACSLGMGVAAGVDHLLAGPHRDFFCPANNVAMAFETCLAVACAGLGLMCGAVSVWFLADGHLSKHSCLEDVARNIEVHLSATPPLGGHHRG